MEPLILLFLRWCHKTCPEPGPSLPHSTNVHYVDFCSIPSPSSARSFWKLLIDANFMHQLAPINVFSPLGVEYYSIWMDVLWLPCIVPPDPQWQSKGICCCRQQPPHRRRNVRPLRLNINSRGRAYVRIGRSSEKYPLGLEIKTTRGNRVTYWHDTRIRRIWLIIVRIIYPPENIALTATTHRLTICQEIQRSIRLAQFMTS